MLRTNNPNLRGFGPQSWIISYGWRQWSVSSPVPARLGLVWLLAAEMGQLGVCQQASLGTLTPWRSRVPGVREIKPPMHRTFSGLIPHRPKHAPHPCSHGHGKGCPGTWMQTRVLAPCSQQEAHCPSSVKCFAIEI